MKFRERVRSGLKDVLHLLPGDSIVVTERRADRSEKVLHVDPVTSVMRVDEIATFDVIEPEELGFKDSGAIAVVIGEKQPKQ